MLVYKYLFIFFFIFTSTLHSENYNHKKEVKSFIKKMNQKYNYKTTYLEMLFKQVKKNPYIKKKKSKAIDSHKKKTLKKKAKKINNIKKGPWDKFSKLYLEQNHTKLGVQFMSKHKKILKKVSKTYGIPPEYITAIIGIESYYGSNNGRYYVFDQLAHLAFEKKKRKKLYRYELQEFLRMCYREQIEPRAVKGSVSGAIGLGQFLPSNYKKFGIDFNKDGKIRMSNPDDAIASIANYFKQHGWERDKPVSVRVSYKGNRFTKFKTGLKYKYQRKDLLNIFPKSYFKYKEKVMLIKLERAKFDELWYATKNFYILTRYNHSSYYAMAVHQLAQKIKKEYN